MNRFQTLNCPSCAAPLDVPESHEQYFRCMACNVVLEDTAYEEPTPDIEVSVARSDIDATDLTAYRQATGTMPTRTGSGCVVWLVLIVVLVGGAVALVTGAFGGSLDEAIDGVASSGTEG
jgi:hypothetical protein